MYNKNILIVDDDQGLLRLLETNLTSSGFQVCTANNGEQGMQMAQERRPDLIILDVLMPSIKGRQVCTQLKSSPETKDIPIIFLTAKNSPDDVKAEIEAGAVAHLTKPINTQKLLAEVKNALGLK